MKTNSQIGEVNHDQIRMQDFGRERPTGQRELLARCDLLEAELAQAKDQKKALERELAVLIDRLGE